MADKSLHSDNNISKKKKGGFFDIEATEVEDVAPVPVKAEGEAEAAVSAEGKKKFRIGAAIFASVLAVLLIGSLILSGMDFIKDSDYNDDGLPEKETVPPIIFEIYDPDWETDIFTLDSYNVLNPHRIEYSDDGGITTTRVDPDRIEKVGGDKLVFLNSYFDAIKRGDHAAVNAMLSEAYIEENGEYEPFPMQKLFNIKITRRYYNDPAFDNGKYEDYYFVVSFNIFRNDGMFRADCDDQYACRTVMRVLLDDEGNGKIDLVRNYYGD
jgi:hypothetical protein